MNILPKFSNLPLQKGWNMKTKFLLFLLALFLIRCAAYKELKPDPELTFRANGFIEIKDDDENFELGKDKKYFMVFPAPLSDNFYLVIDIAEKQFLNSYLTNTFDDGEGRIIEIKDESNDPARFSAYSVDNSVQKFYWVIDLVKQDVLLDVDYRYVEKWRYQFETRYAAFQETVTMNTVDRSPYRTIGSGFDHENFNYSAEITSIKNKTAKITEVQQSLSELEKIFPPNIANTNDQAYQDYINLKLEVDEELNFHKNYLTVLGLLQNVVESRGNTAAFIDGFDAYLDFYEQKDNYPQNINKTISKLVGERLPEIVPFYENEIGLKKDASLIAHKFDEADELYKYSAANKSDNYMTLANFAKAYNEKVNKLTTAKDQLAEIESTVKSQSKFPSVTFFGDVLTKIKKLQYNLPKTLGSSYGKYSKYHCVSLLNGEIRAMRSKVSKKVDQYRQADRLIPQLNTFKKKKDYRSMRRLLKNNAHLGFLKDMYKPLDQLSLNGQKNKINQAMTSQNWLTAETSLRSLHNDQDFVDLASVIPQKKKLVKSLEDTLYARIDRLSRQRARRFIDENINTLENVPELYNSLAFKPVHEITFASGGQKALERKTGALNDYLGHLKNVEFPELAIKHLYSEVTRNPSDNGVMKTRAIADHGKNYTGNDKKIKQRVGECDPWASKWITKAKEYRKIFALPSTSKRSGLNEYVFRLNIRIPSEAKFPVFDINIKLPKEVAKDASSSQWYEKMTMNNKLLKNEGRFTITAPNAANNYECQVGPVRMDKDSDNVLEVRFNHNSFKIFEVSVMAQKPIIKKH